MKKHNIRVWSIDDKEMYYQMKDLPCFGLTPDNENTKKIDYVDVFFYFKNRFIVLLSTGLKDKNGKYVYEGDKVQHDHYGTFIIEHDNELTGFFMRDLLYPLEDDSAHFNMSEIDKCIVIGNIYEVK